jgi:RNA polymerase sigma factor (sigma-70 family)
MPHKPEIDVAKLKARDTAEWERAFPPLSQAGLDAASAFWSSMGNLDEEDFAQGAIIKAYERRARFTSFEHMCKFVAAATKNAILDELEKRKRLKHGGGKVGRPDQVGLGDVGIGDVAEPGDDLTGWVPYQKKMRPDEALNQRQMADLVQSAFQSAFLRIDRRYGQVVWDTHIEKLKQKVIAKRRGLAVGSIGNYLDRGLKALQKFLPEREKVFDDLYKPRKPRKRHERKKANPATG